MPPAVLSPSGEATGWKQEEEVGTENWLEKMVIIITEHHVQNMGLLVENNEMV